MQDSLDSGNNINSADYMFEAMWPVIAPCHFMANVLDIKQAQIKNISKIYHVKFIYDDIKKKYHK